jgi:hypothetical protein
MARDGIENTTQVWGRAAASVRARVGPGMGRRRAARTLGLRKTGTGVGCGRQHGRWGGRAYGWHWGDGAAVGARTALEERVAYALGWVRADRLHLRCGVDQVRLPARVCWQWRWR